MEEPCNIIQKAFAMVKAWQAASRRKGINKLAVAALGGITNAGIAAVSYTHLTLPTICSV
eukprot:5448958-Prorocentrum_lima.AAC.1